MALGDYAGLRTERRAGRMAEIEKREAGLTERARIAAAATKKPVMGSIETPAAEVPYLPEAKEKGRLGDIMRASPKELEAIYEKMPETERPVEALRGTERTFWSPGTKQEYGDLRTAMTGFRQRPVETTAAGRLSAANQRQAREQMFEDYDIKTTDMFSPHITRGPEGEEMIPGWARELYSAGKAMSLEDPEGAIRHVEGALSERKRIQTEARDMEEADLMAAAGLDPETGVPMETPRVTEAAGMSTTPRVAARKTYAERMEEWNRAEAEEKEKLAGYVGISPAYIKPLGAVKRSFTKPIRREHLGRQADYTGLFGSQ